MLLAIISKMFVNDLKPFEERELQSTIEMGLYKHKMQRMLKESQQRLATTLNSLDEAILTTDAQSRITFMNPMAELLTSWKKETLIRRILETAGSHSQQEEEFTY